MKAKKSFKGKLIKLVVENFSETEISLISQELLQEYLNKYLSFETNVSTLASEEYEHEHIKCGSVTFTDENNKPHVIDFDIQHFDEFIEKS